MQKGELWSHGGGAKDNVLNHPSCSVSRDEQKRLGRWKTNDSFGNSYADPIPVNGSRAAAGWFPFETIDAPYLRVSVPRSLQLTLFPFIEVALETIKSLPMNVQTNLHGLKNHLQGLDFLRKFGWLVSFIEEVRSLHSIHRIFTKVMGIIYLDYPSFPLFRDPVFSSPAAKAFFKDFAASLELATREFAAARVETDKVQDKAIADALKGINQNVIYLMNGMERLQQSGE